MEELSIEREKITEEFITESAFRANTALRCWLELQLTVLSGPVVSDTIIGNRLYISEIGSSEINGCILIEKDDALRITGVRLIELKSVLCSPSVEYLCGVASTGDDEVPVVTAFVALHIVPNLLGLHSGDGKILEHENWSCVLESLADTFQHVVE
jgi:hypothetical protein